MGKNCKCQRPEPEEVRSFGGDTLGYVCKACGYLIYPVEETCKVCGFKRKLWEKTHLVPCDRCAKKAVCPKEKRCSSCLKYVELRCIICGDTFETNRPSGRKLCNKLACFAEQGKNRRKAAAKEAKARKGRRARAEKREAKG